MNSLGNRVNVKMRDLGMTQDELAYKVGISQASIQRIICGKTSNPKKILELSKALKTTPEWLMFGDEPESKSTINVEVEKDKTSELKLSVIASVQELNLKETMLLKNFVDLLKSTHDETNRLNHA